MQKKRLATRPLWRKMVVANCAVTEQLERDRRSL